MHTLHTCIHYIRTFHTFYTCIHAHTLLCTEPSSPKRLIKEAIYGRLLNPTLSLNYDWERAHYLDVDEESFTEQHPDPRRQGKLRKIPNQWLTFLRSTNFAQKLAKRVPEIAEREEIDKRIFAHNLPLENSHPDNINSICLPLNGCRDPLHNFWDSNGILKKHRFTQSLFKNCPHFRCKFCCGLYLLEHKIQKCTFHYDLDFNKCRTYYNSVAQLIPKPPSSPPRLPPPCLPAPRIQCFGCKKYITEKPKVLHCLCCNSHWHHSCHLRKITDTPYPLYVLPCCRCLPLTLRSFANYLSFLSSMHFSTPSNPPPPLFPPPFPSSILPPSSHTRDSRAIENGSRELKGAQIDTSGRDYDLSIYTPPYLSCHSYHSWRIHVVLIFLSSCIMSHGVQSGIGRI